MKIGIFAPQKPAEHYTVLRAIHAGVCKMRIDSFFRDLYEGWAPCDIAVTFGVLKVGKYGNEERGLSVGKVIQKQIETGARNVVVEKGFVRRQTHYMIGFGGLNGRAEFFNQNMPGDRWRLLNMDILPWRLTGNHILLAGQVPWDASVQHIDYLTWIQQTAAEVRKHYSVALGLRFRPHPMQPEAVSPLPGFLTSQENLAGDLDNARAVVTFNSNTSVDAALHGVPFYVADRGAVAYHIANHDLGRLLDPVLPERTQFFNDLAYSQWTIDEMSEGFPWRHFATQGAI